jgi:RNA polymerase sigma-70 factor (ECF subfamily)
MYRPPPAPGLPGLRCAVLSAPNRLPAGTPRYASDSLGPPAGHLLLSITAGAAAGAPSSSFGLPAPAQPSLRHDPVGGRIGQLVDAAKSGDSEAFAGLYDRYLDTVYRYVYYRVGSRQLAEDLTSETFLRALRRIDSFNWQGRDFGAWLVTIARNLVADHFKSSRFRLEITTADMVEAAGDDEVAEGPESAVIRTHTNVELMDAVKRLNAAQQECLVLRFLQGFSVAETARAMGKNEGAIKTLQYRAIRTLAQLLPEHGP